MNISPTRKQHIIVFILFVLINIPNIIFVVLGQDSAVNTFTKQIAFFLFTLSLAILPLSFLKPKIYFGILLLLSPLLLIDIYILFLTKTQSTSMYYTSVLVTNLNESKELILGNLGFFLLGIILLLSYLFLLFKLESKLILNKIFKLIIGLMSIFMIAAIFIRDVKIANSTKSSNGVFQTAITYFTLKLDKTHPLGSIHKVTDVIKGQQLKNTFDTNNKDFSYHSKVFNNENKTIVLVIGETARKNNFQLYGYSRKTNPKLSKIENLIVFEDFTTNSNFTNTSFSQIVSSVGPNNYQNLFYEKGLVSAFKEAGFNTYWITNQPYSPGSIYHLFSKEADFYKDVSNTFEMKSFDSKILPHFNSILNDNHKKRLIIIHSIGSHYRYNFRYPKKYSVFKPQLDGSISISGINPSQKELFVNAYDNSILYTDYFLSELITSLNKENNQSYLMYISDHGENLFDDKKELVLHGSINPTKYEIEVPFMIWHSNNYNKKNANQLQSNKKKKVSSQIVFHTLSSLAGFKTKLHQNKNDLLSDSLKTGDRLFLKSDGSIMNIDNKN